MIDTSKNIGAVLAAIRDVFVPLINSAKSSADSAKSSADSAARLTDIQSALGTMKTSLQGNDATATLAAIKSLVAALPSTDYTTAINAISTAVSSVSSSMLKAQDKQDILTAIAAATPTIDFTSVLTAISTAKGEVVAAMPSTTGLATEQNATSNKQAVIDAIPSDYAKESSGRLQSIQERINSEVDTEDVEHCGLYGIAAELGYDSEHTLQEKLSMTLTNIQTLKTLIGNDRESVTNNIVSKELSANKTYVFAARTANLTLTLGAVATGKSAEYHFFIESAGTPTITWPTGISWYLDDVPTIQNGHKYEINIEENIAAYLEV